MKPLLFLRGRWFVFWSVEPFTTQPVSGFYLPVFFFSCMVCSPTPCALFLSLSGAGETQTPFGVWVSPCVLCIPGRGLHLQPVLINFPKASPRTCFFFSFSSSFALGCGRWLVPGGVSVRVLFSVDFWFWFGRCCSLVFLHLLLHRKTALPGIRPQRRLPPFPPPIGLSGVTRLLLGVVPWKGRSVAGWECRRLCDPTTFRMLTTINTVVLPHRWPPLQRTQAVSPVLGFFGGFLFLFATQLRR